MCKFKDERQPQLTEIADKMDALFEAMPEWMMFRNTETSIRCKEHEFKYNKFRCRDCEFCVLNHDWRVGDWLRKRCICKHGEEGLVSGLEYSCANFKEKPYDERVAFRKMLKAVKP